LNNHQRPVQNDESEYEKKGKMKMKNEKKMVEKETNNKTLRMMTTTRGTELLLYF
jgi:hypothetical protein